VLPDQSHSDQTRNALPSLAKPSPEAIEAASRAFRSARDELEYFGASEDFTRNPIEAALEAAYAIDSRRGVRKARESRPGELPAVDSL
jgi:hypothetical protein